MKLNQFTNQEKQVRCFLYMNNNKVYRSLTKPDVIDFITVYEIDTQTKNMMLDNFKLLADNNKKPETVEDMKIFELFMAITDLEIEDTEQHRRDFKYIINGDNILLLELFNEVNTILIDFFKEIETKANNIQLSPEEIEKQKKIEKLKQLEAERKQLEAEING